jgi:hypothetical protein
MSQQCPMTRTPILLLASLFTISICATAHAGECLSSPNVASTPGKHWYYWTDKNAHRRCWFVKENAESPRGYAPEDTSSLSSQSGRASGQALSVAPIENESWVQDWFSSTFPSLGGSGRWGSSTEKREPPVSELPVTGKYLRKDITQLKKPEQSKQKNKSEHVRSEHAQNESTRAQHRSARLPVRLLEAASEKYVPDAALKLQQDRQKSAIKAVGRKDVITPRTDLEEWQRALYEEFLVWRTKQLIFHDAD